MPPPAAADGPLPLPNCYWVLPGTLLAGEYPAGGTPEGDARAPGAAARGRGALLRRSDRAGRARRPTSRCCPRHRLLPPPDPRSRPAGKPGAHGRDPRLPAPRAALAARGLPALPRRHRTHRHGRRVPAGRAGALGRGGAGGAQPALARQRPRPRLAAGPGDRRAERVRPALDAAHRARPAARPGDPRRRPRPARPLRGRAHRPGRRRCGGGGHAVSAARAASHRSGTCSAAARSTCRAGPGATTRR